MRARELFSVVGLEDELFGIYENSRYNGKSFDNYCEETGQFSPKNWGTSKIMSIVENTEYCFEIKFAIQNNQDFFSLLKDLYIESSSKDIVVSFEKNATHWGVSGGNFPTKLFIKANKATSVELIKLKFIFAPEQKLFREALLFCIVNIPQTAKNKVEMELIEGKTEGVIIGRIGDNKTLSKKIIGQRIDFRPINLIDPNQGYYNRQKTYADKVDIKYAFEGCEIRGISVVGDTSFVSFRSSYNYFSTYTNTETGGKSGEQHEQSGEVICIVPCKIEWDKLKLTQILCSEKLDLKLAKFDSGFTAFWKEVENACLYNIEIFRVWFVAAASCSESDNWGGNNKSVELQNHAIAYKANSKKMVYVSNNKAVSLHDIQYMTKQNVDRNDCFFSFGSVANGAYLVRVYAENKAGKVIAKSYAEIIEI